MTRVSSRSLTHPFIAVDLPEARPAELSAGQAGRESNAGNYPRRLSMVIDRVLDSFVYDADGNSFIYFRTGAGVLPLGHNDLELVEVVDDQLRGLTHSVDFPTRNRDGFVEAQAAMLSAAVHNHMNVHSCGPTGANAVDAAIKRAGTATTNAISPSRRC